MSKGKKTLLASVCVIMCVLVLGLCGSVAYLAVQLGNLKQIVAESAYSGLHELYDDTAVVNAYLSGNADKLSEEDKFVLESAKAVIKETIKDGMSEYEKEKAIYDWQIKYIAFDESNTSAIEIDGGDDPYTPYLVFKVHSAICVGNATTFKLFMDLLGIDCKIIHSVSEGEHAWNMVKIDGNWYHCDVTFDNGSNGVPAYASFNVPDTVIDNNGYDYDTSEYPAATAVKDCYIYKNATEVTDLYTLPAIIKKAMDDGKSSVYIRYENKQDDATGTQAGCSGCDTYQISEASEIVTYISDTYISSTDSYVYLTEQPFAKDIYIGVISIESMENGDNSESTVDYERLDEAAMKAFDDSSAMG